MARALWIGTLSFGLVNIPVRLYPAARRKNVRFKEIDSQTGQRVHHQRVRFPLDGEIPWGAPDQAEVEEESPAAFGEKRERPGRPEVTAGEVVKGYEVAPDTFVTVTQSEIEELRPERTRTIDIEEFVEAAAVDPAYFDTSYHVAPQREFERPFALLVDSLSESGKLAICWIVLRKRRHLAALRPHQGLLLLSTLFFADEVVPVEDVSAPPAEKPTDRELKMAALLIDSMSAEYQPSRYADDFRQRLLDLIASRQGAAREAPAAPPVAGGGVEDLMAALEASLAQVRKPARRRRTG